MANVISKEQAIQIVDSLDFHEVISKITEENPRSPFHSMDCYLDLSTGQVFYRLMGNNESFQENLFICLFSQPGNFAQEFSEEDIAGDDEIPEGGVEAFQDYDDRVLDAVLYYQLEGRDPKGDAYQRVEQYYAEMEMFEAQKQWIMEEEN